MNKQLSFNRLTSALVITIASSMLLASCGGSAAPAPQASKPVTVTPAQPTTGTTQGGNASNSGSNNSSNNSGTVNNGSTNSGSNSSVPQPTPTPEAQNKPQLPAKPSNNSLTLATGAVAGTIPVTNPSTKKGSSNPNQPPVVAQSPTPTFKQGEGSIVLANNIQIDNDVAAKVSVNKAANKVVSSDLTNELFYKWTKDSYDYAFNNKHTVINDYIPKNTTACVYLFGGRCPQTSIEKVIDTNTAGDLFSKPDDRASRVLLVGDEMTSVTTAESTGRVDREYVNKAQATTLGKENDIVGAEDKSEHKYANEVELATWVMKGKPTAASESYKVAGLLNLWGRIKFLGHTQYQTATAEQVYGLARTSQFQQSLDNNYKIVLFSKIPTPQTNATLDSFIKSKLSTADQVKFNFTQKLQENGGDLVKTLNQVGYLDYIANQYELPILNYHAQYNDALFIIPTGNQLNSYSQLGLALQATGQDYSALRNAVIFVSGYHPDDLITNIYDYKATPCGAYNKYACVIAYDSIKAEFNDQTIKQQGGNPQDAVKTQVSTSTLNSAAQVAALAATLKGVFPFMTNTNLQTTILSTVESLSGSVDETDGSGLIRPEVALNGPSKIYNGNFTVDLAHNQGLFESRTKFYFNNPIQGSGDLVVTGDDHNIRLVLTNNSGYTGNTLVKGQGHLEVRGRLDGSPTVDIDTQATLSGDGFVKNLYNRGTVQGYALDDHAKIQASLKFNHSSNEFTSSKVYALESRGLTVTGNFQQTSTGTLSVLLGQPVIVYGDATLNGTLQIDGLSKGLLTADDYVIGDVLVAKGKINGVFSKLSSSSPLVDVYAEGTAQIPHTYTTTAGKVNALLLKAKYQSAATAMLQSSNFTSAVAREIAFTGGQNIDRLYYGVRNVASVQLSSTEDGLNLAADDANLVSDNSTEAGTSANAEASSTPTNAPAHSSGAETTASGMETSTASSTTAQPTESNSSVTNDSPLRNLLASLLDGTQDQVRATAQAFAGREFVDTATQHQLLTRHALNSATQRLYDLRDLEQVTTGYGALNATQSYLGNSQGATSNLTTLAYEYQLPQQRFVAGVTVGNSSWQHSQAATADSKHRSYGIFAGTTLALPQANDWGVSGVVSYQQHNTELQRQVQVANLAAQSLSDKIITSDLNATATLLKSFTWQQHYFQAYAGTTYNYGRWHGEQDVGVVETYPGFTLTVQPQSLSFWDAFIGGKYSYRNLFAFAGLQLDLDYKLSGELAGWQELQGSLADAQYRVAQSYSRGALGLTHQVSAQVSQQVNDNVTLQAQGALLHAGSTTYRLASLGLQVKF